MKMQKHTQTGRTVDCIRVGPACAARHSDRPRTVWRVVAGCRVSKVTQPQLVGEKPGRWGSG